jgi:hypothetical protein
MQAFRGQHSNSDQRKEKKEGTACNKNLGIWAVKEMTFACFIPP